jgi:hypothetical protein
MSVENSPPGYSSPLAAGTGDSITIDVWHWAA